MRDTFQWCPCTFKLIENYRVLPDEVLSWCCAVSGGIPWYRRGPLMTVYCQCRSSYGCVLSVEVLSWYGTVSLGPLSVLYCQCMSFHGTVLSVDVLPWCCTVGTSHILPFLHNKQEGVHRFRKAAWYADLWQPGMKHYFWSAYIVNGNCEAGTTFGHSPLIILYCKWRSSHANVLVVLWLWPDVVISLYSTVLSWYYTVSGGTLMVLCCQSNSSHGTVLFSWGHLIAL